MADVFCSAADDSVPASLPADPAARPRLVVGRPALATAVAVCAAIAGAAAVAWLGRGPVLAAEVWVDTTAECLTIAAAIGIAIVCLGRHRVFGERRSLWIAAASMAYTILTVLYLALYPGLIGDGALIAAHAAAWAWAFHAKWTAFAILLGVATFARSRTTHPLPETTVVAVVGSTAVVMGLALTVLAPHLPPLLHGSRFSTLNLVWTAALAVSFAVTGAGALHRGARTSQPVLVYTGLLQLVLAVRLGTDVFGGDVFDVVWYVNRALLVAAFGLVMLGLLLDYVRLMQRERLISRQARARAAELQATLDSLTDAVVVVGASGEVVDVNRPALELFGARDRSEVSWAAAIETPLALDEFLLGRALAGKTVRGVMVDAHTADAATRSLEISAAPIRNGRGAPAGAVVVLRDVTEIESARARAVVTRAATAVAAVLDVTDLVEAVLGEVRLALGLDLVMLHEVAETGSLRMLGAHGLPPELAGTMGHVELDASLMTARAARERRIQVFEDLLEAPPDLAVARRLAEQFGFRTGVAAPLLVRGEPVGTMFCGRHGVRAFSAREIETIVTVADIVAVGLANARLHRAAEDERQRLETVIAHLPAGVMFVEPTAGRVTIANAEVERLLGGPVNGSALPADEHASGIRRPDGSAFPPGALPSSRALRGEVVLAEEVLIEAADRPSRFALVNAAPVRDARRHTAGAVVTIQDISRVKELERMREEFISIVAHDLRTPVGVIQNYAHVLDQHARRRHDASPGAGTETDGVELKAIDGIAVSARRLATMVADLLDASRVETHRLALARETLDVSHLLAGLVDRMRPLLGGRRVVLDIQGAPPAVDADPGRIEQVVANLLTNAAKFSPDGADVTVTVKGAESEVVVAVADRGPGIPAAERAAIFDRFYRAPATTGGRDGLGLGLYIARGLVEAHGGRMWADSRPGGGTRVCFALPVRASGSPAPPR